MLNALNCGGFPDGQALESGNRCPQIAVVTSLFGLVPVDLATGIVTCSWITCQSPDFLAGEYETSRLGSSYPLRLPVCASTFSTKLKPSIADDHHQDPWINAKAQIYLVLGLAWRPRAVTL